MNQNAPTLKDKRTHRASKLHGPITQRFLDESEHYNFKFKCEECMFFNDESGDCVHLYPNEAHRKQYYDQEPLGKILIFCREFELA